MTLNTFEQLILKTQPLFDILATTSSCVKRFLCCHLKKKNSAHQHTGSTGSAAGNLGDSCTCIHPLSSDSHADTCGFRRTRPCLPGTSTNHHDCKCFISVTSPSIALLFFRPSQLCPLGSNEYPLWQSQLKLPGEFWQTPLEPHRFGSVEHSLLSVQREEEVQAGERTGR